MLGSTVPPDEFVDAAWPRTALSSSSLSCATSMTPSSRTARRVSREAARRGELAAIEPRARCQNGCALLATQRSRTHHHYHGAASQVARLPTESCVWPNFSKEKRMTHHQTYQMVFFWDPNSILDWRQDRRRLIDAEQSFKRAHAIDVGAKSSPEMTRRDAESSTVVALRVADERSSGVELSSEHHRRDGAQRELGSDARAGAEPRATQRRSCVSFCPS